MKCIFKWVHLSDLHFQTKALLESDFNSTELKKKLPEFISTNISDVNALILTGDYRFAPDKEENPQKSANFIITLAKSLNLDLSCVYLVPGNHDLSRSVIRNDVIRGLRDEYSTENGVFDAERLENLKKGFTFFDKLRSLVYESASSSPMLSTENPHYAVALDNCNLLLLNTALTAGMESNKVVEDEHHLLLGSRYLSAAVHEIENHKPTIMIGHHGLQYLQDNEIQTCTQFLEEAHIHLYLCGHTHQLWNSAFSEHGKQITVGCMLQREKSVDAGFSVGQLFDDGTVDLESYKWDVDNQNWYPNPPQKKEYKQLYPIAEEPRLTEESDSATGTDAEGIIIQKANPFSLKGYFLLGGRGIDGIKYLWEKDGRNIESLAFNRRLKDSEDPEISRISAYTCSVSYGCRLSLNDKQCLFCETGKLKYYGDACAKDVALQNIFMAAYDADCPSFPQVRSNKREFAFMGQGEPGFCYPSVRRAIQLTDYAMAKIHQEVHRYIISTCGICDFIPLLISDIKNGTFQNKVTLHFSLHAIDDERTMLIPANEEHNYKRFIKECEKLYAETGEKIGVGLLMFNKYKFSGGLNGGRPYSLTPARLEKMLQILNKDIFRIDLCDVNHSSGGSQQSFSNEHANNLLHLVISKGFEGKLFSSFGDNEQSGCGMLASFSENINIPGSTTIMHFNRALDLLNEAIDSLDNGC